MIDLYSEIPEPRLMYGTAWKENRTEALTLMALRTGCRAIDTANQRKHYFEAGVGAALKTAYESNLVRREDLFLQTKFTYRRGQDERLPYDPSQPLNRQVEQSFASSQEHLGCEMIDSYILHGPASGYGVTDDDVLVWQTMETLQKKKYVRFLGLSNVSLMQLKKFYDIAAVKPAFVQNRCYASTKWDYDIREYCYDRGIIYQGFSLLTANVDYLVNDRIKKIANEKRCTIAQLVFRFAQQVGMWPLTGTTNSDHLLSDIKSKDIALTDDELEIIETIAFD